MGGVNLGEMGERIRAGRERLALTQRDVASALQVSNQAVSKWERGENAPDVEVLGGLAQLLGVSVDALLGTHGREGEVFEATVFLSSLNGSSQRLAALSERDGAVWLNGVLCQVTEAVLRHDGVPVKYMGDGVLAFFAGPAHRDRGVRAAVLAKEVVGQALCVGLHAGPIYLGRIGHPEYAQRDVVGPTITAAVRTHQWAIANATGVGATSIVVEGLADQALRALAGPAHTVALKSVEGPTLLHDLAAPA
jgi:transcriptional regulator with XRE-family HTH domain